MRRAAAGPMMVRVLATDCPAAPAPADPTVFRLVVADDRAAAPSALPSIAHPEVTTTFRDGLERALAKQRSPAETRSAVRALADLWTDAR